jgi:hypothetical protein
MPNPNVAVTLNLTGTLGYSSDQDPSGGQGTVVTGVVITPDEIDPPISRSAFDVSFSLELPSGMTAVLKNFRYFNDGSSVPADLGWWSPHGNAPDGASPQPTGGGLHPTWPQCYPNPPTTAVEYKGKGTEFVWKPSFMNILDKVNNTLLYYYIVEFQITSGARVGTYVIDPQIKNW